MKPQYYKVNETTWISRPLIFLFESCYFYFICYDKSTFRSTNKTDTNLNEVHQRCQRPQERQENFMYAKKTFFLQIRNFSPQYVHLPTRLVCLTLNPFFFFSYHTLNCRETLLEWSLSFKVNFLSGNSKVRVCSILLISITIKINPHKRNCSLFLILEVLRYQQGIISSRHLAKLPSQGIT